MSIDWTHYYILIILVNFVPLFIIMFGISRELGKTVDERWVK